MEKQPDEPMSEPMEVQDAVAPTLGTPFAQPIIAASKSKAQRQREYRQRIGASRTPAQAAAARKSKTERQRNNRLRQAAILAIASRSLEATTTIEPLSPAIPVPVEVQEAVASTSATPFAEPITAAPKTRAQIQREYRQRIAASRTPAQAAAAREARNLRDRNNRLREVANLAIASGSLEATSTSSSRSGQRLITVHIDTQRQFTDQQRQTLATEPVETTVQPSTSSDQIEVQAQSTGNTKWASSIMRSKSTFLDNDFGYTCSVYDRLWVRNDLKPITAAQLKLAEVDASGPSGRTATGSRNSRDSLDAQRTEQDPLRTKGLDQCRFCAEFTKDCVEITGDKPYLNNNKTALTLNNDSVELDFNDTLPKTVCRHCDGKLQDMYDFVKQVKVAQELMINVTDETKNVETLIVKTECDSPTPEDDSKDGIIESITVTETEFVKPVTNKRKCDNVTTKQKKRKVSEDSSELIIDIKEETIDIEENPLNGKTALEISDTGTDDKPSELDLATQALVNVMAGDDGLS